MCFSIDQNTANRKELLVLQQFYKDMQNLLLIDELLPKLVSKKIITTNDKILVTECKNINERFQFFLENYIAKPLSAGDSTSFYKLLQIMESSSKYNKLAAEMKQSLMSESLQDNISGEYG